MNEVLPRCKQAKNAFEFLSLKINSVAVQEMSVGTTLLANLARAFYLFSESAIPA